MSAIAAALVEFQKTMPTAVKKNKTAKVPTKAGGSYTYTYADLGDVQATVLPLLLAQGIAFTCLPRQVDGGYELVGTLLHTSGERLEGSLPLHGRTPQEIGGAITYARRYLLGSLTGVVTDDDADGHQNDHRVTAVAPVDWEELVSLAEVCTDERGLRYLWDRYNVAGSPEEVQQRFNQKLADLRNAGGV